MTAFDRLSRLSRTAKERGSSIWNSTAVFTAMAAAGMAVAAWIALMRHHAQTDAERQRRITESFSKAAEQLASDKLEERLGGIYTLERISQESKNDYWPVMETLTAFVRERTRRTEAERTSKPFDQRVAERAYFLWEKAGCPEEHSEEFRAEAVELEKLGDPPPMDIAAVLTVINRRSKKSRERERTKGWRLDFSGAVLRLANLTGVHLERARLIDAHLEEADLTGAHLERARLWNAHLERAHLWNTHFERARLTGAHLEEADLRGAHLERADLSGAHLEGADLRESVGLSKPQLEYAIVDASTQLPEGMARPTSS